jgi:glutamine cyclotransferase
MSEGTNRIIYIDPATMKATKTLTVTDDYGAVTYLNELEFVDGFIYANKYGTDFIVKIDPATGKVVGRIDFARLAQQAKQANPASLEMNGIAYNAASKRWYVTGKMWPYLFEVTIP